MALTIGGVTFSIDANTKGIQAASAKLDAFGKRIDSIARRQSAGAKASVAALTKQESKKRWLL